MMKSMESFLILYHLLEQCYDIDPGDKSSEELILSDFLSDIDPTLWADGRPMDQAIFYDWVEQTDIPHLSEKNIISAVLNFVSFYEKRGFYFGRVREILQGTSSDTMIKNAIKFARSMYEKYSYSD